MTRGSDTIKCSCSAYKFPHRLGGGKCTQHYLPQSPLDEMDLARDEAIRQQEKEDDAKDRGNSN